MAPNNIEKQIREKLNTREIQPSAQAWDRLDAMLTVSEQPKKKTLFRWFYIAASLVGLFLAALFINQSKPNTKIEETKIVNSDKTNKTKFLNSKEQNPKIIFSEKKQNNVVSTKNSNSKKNIKQAIEIQPFVAPKISVQEEQIVEQKVEIAQQFSEKTITEPVLAATINTTSIPNNFKSKIKINPKSLLDQVDGELDLTFKEKIIQKYKTTKVAFENRNQQ